MNIDLSRFADRFRQETRDNLALLDGTINALDSVIRTGTGSDDILREIMRIAHAIKGAARMLGFTDVNRLCHSLEEMVIRLREVGDLKPGYVDLIAETRRGIERLLHRNPGDEGGVEWLEQLINDLQSGRIAAVEGLPQSKPVTQSPVVNAPTEPDRLSTDAARMATVRVDVESIDDILYYGRELSQALDDLRKSQQSLSALKYEFEEVLSHASVARGDLIQCHRSDLESLQAKLSSLALILRERVAEVDRNVRQIDTGAVELRMRPISELFETIPLQVRDLARSLKKEVEVDLAGEGVRLDGRIVELLREPIIHVIRNAIDHGLESAEEREAVGKSPAGRLTVGAFENAGWARVMIADDGRGIDLGKVWNRAVQLGLAKAVPTRSDELKEGYRFLFDDRFTSKGTASDISGRGVGLAAVRRRMQELRGDVRVDSVAGMGARFTLTMPSSLSSQRVMITLTRIDGEPALIGFPTAMVKATGRRENWLESGVLHNSVSGDDIAKSISLARLLEGEAVLPSKEEQYLIHCTDGLRSAALAVERIIAETEVVIEPLPHVARSASLIAGAAASTTDDILLVVNVPSLLTKTHTNQSVSSAA